MLTTTDPLGSQSGHSDPPFLNTKVAEPLLTDYRGAVLNAITTRLLDTRMRLCYVRLALQAPAPLPRMCMHIHTHFWQLREPSLELCVLWVAHLAG